MWPSRGLNTLISGLSHFHFYVCVFVFIFDYINNSVLYYPQSMFSAINEVIKLNNINLFESEIYFQCSKSYYSWLRKSSGLQLSKKLHSSHYQVRKVNQSKQFIITIKNYIFNSIKKKSNVTTSTKIVQLSKSCRKIQINQ